MRSILRLVVVFLVFPVSPGLSWENHAFLAEVAVSSMQEIANAKPVKVESMEEFLLGNEKLLVDLLKKEELWAQKNVENYRKIPKGLMFEAGDKSDIKQRFLNAIRVNPNSKFTLFLQELRERESTVTYLGLSEITLLPNSLPKSSRNFIELKPGQEVNPKDVFVTASDEPDYGLDIGLWSDSHTSFGEKYGFGAQPFGNPKLEYSSQAPFHMGFFHESPVLAMLAKDKMRSLVEYRIHQFHSLARFAFQTGHDYWGWRFAGLGVHYIQDLTQPYHTTMMPGESLFSLLSISALDALGFERSKKELIERASDEHSAIERFVLCGIRNSNNKKGKSKSVRESLAFNDKKYFPYNPGYVRKLLTSQSSAFSERIAAEIKPIVAAFTVDSEACPIKYSATTSPVFMELMNNLGVHTRSWVKSAGKI